MSSIPKIASTSTDGQKMLLVQACNIVLAEADAG